MATQLQQTLKGSFDRRIGDTGLPFSTKPVGPISFPGGASDFVKKTENAPAAPKPPVKPPAPGGGGVYGGFYSPRGAPAGWSPYGGSSLYDALANTVSRWNPDVDWGGGRGNWVESLRPGFDKYLAAANSRWGAPRVEGALRSGSNLASAVAYSLASVLDPNWDDVAVYNRRGTAPGDADTGGLWYVPGYAPQGVVNDATYGGRRPRDIWF